MQFLLISILSILVVFAPEQKEWVIDFGAGSGGEYWYVTNDGIMGGVSQGRAYLSDSSVVFSGTVSLENNGGFASIRSPYQQLGLSEFSEVEIKARASGLPFSVTFSKDRRFYVPNYKYLLDLDSNEWSITTFKLSDLKEYRIGNPTNRNIPESDINNLIGISFINEGKKEGEFMLEVDYIQFR